MRVFILVACHACFHASLSNSYLVKYENLQTKDAFLCRFLVLGVHQALVTCVNCTSSYINTTNSFANNSGDEREIVNFIKVPGLLVEFPEQFCSHFLNFDIIMLIFAAKKPVRLVITTHIFHLVTHFV